MSIEDLRQSRYWTEHQGREALALWRRSGKPLATFARDAGLSRTRLTYWSARSGASSSTQMVELAPVTVVPMGARCAITIELRSGRAVRVEGDVDDAILARVIATAERAC